MKETVDVGAHRIHPVLIIDLLYSMHVPNHAGIINSTYEAEMGHGQIVRFWIHYGVD